MMKILIVKPMVVSLALLLGGGGAQAAGQNVLFACTGADGSIAVSSEATSDNCEQIAVPPEAAVAPASVPAAAAKHNAAAASRNESPDRAATGNLSDPAAAEVAAAELPPLETRLSSYRDTMLQGAAKAEGAPAAAKNPAVNRRYLMTNRSAYRAAH